MATTGRIAEVLFENTLETIEDQTGLIDKVSFFEPDAETTRNAGNVIWRPREQQAPILTGWDLSGQEQDIIEETYPAILAEPKNDFVRQRADELRTTQFWERRGVRSGMQQMAELNQTIAEAIVNQGSLFYRSNATNGFNFIAEAQAIMNERQGYNSGNRCFYLNDRDTLTFAGDLSGRETVRGRPEEAWSTGQIGSGVAEFDVFTGSFLPRLTGGTSTTITVTSDQSFSPEGGTVNTSTGEVTNVDYRRANIPVSNNSGFSVGDKITISNSGTTIKAVGVSDKTNTDQAMTFTVVGTPAGQLTISPKPIALDDTTNLNVTERAYANVDTRILSGATITRLNTDASARTNLFWDKDAVEVYGGTIPAQLFAQFDGMKVVTQSMSNGLDLYMIYDGNIEDMTFRYRLFTWYNITIKDPERVGSCVSFT